MKDMFIRPGHASKHEPACTAGRFSDDADSYIVNHVGVVNPFGRTLCNLDTDYSINILPDGSGKSCLNGFDITSPSNLGKAWYIKDSVMGEVWSAFFGPVREKCDEYQVRIKPGIVSVYTLKNKVASILTICASSDFQGEIWHLKFENRSSTERSISFTTYVEPFMSSPVKTQYVDKGHLLLLEDAVSNDQKATLFHSSTLIPSRYQTEKSDFIGEKHTLSDPIYIENSDLVGCDGEVKNAIASFSVDVELPIEGEAEFGFCFGVADNSDQAIKIAGSMSDITSINQAIKTVSDKWTDSFSSFKVYTSDPVFDGLVNSWLPYEIYSEWTKNRGAIEQFNPWRLADILRRFFPFARHNSALFRKSILEFTSRLSVAGGYHLDEQSKVAITNEELLWLAITTAKYVSETGDVEILSSETAFRDGPSLTLREHCERCIRLCMNNNEMFDNPSKLALIEQAVNMWSLLFKDDIEFANYLDIICRRKKENVPNYKDDFSLPTRIAYLQGVCKSLNDRLVSNLLDENFAHDENSDREGDLFCRLYSVIIEKVLGINTIMDGIHIDEPQIPAGWLECSIVKHFRNDIYNIQIKRSPSLHKGVVSVVFDGNPVSDGNLPFIGDGREHFVEVKISEYLFR